jgi:beta-N-acetylhexosaminidase
LIKLVTLTDVLQNAGAIEKNEAQYPLFISIDQEGGLVYMLPFGPWMPGNIALGACKSEKLTYDVARGIGHELACLDITMNFAPVLDVETNQDNPVIGVRSFGGDPIMVAKQGNAYIMGMQEIPVYFASYAGRTGSQNLVAVIRAITAEIPVQGTFWLQ